MQENLALSNHVGKRPNPTQVVCTTMTKMLNFFSFFSAVHGRGGVPGHLLVRALGRPPPPGGGGLAQALPPVHAIRLPGADAAGRSRAGG